MTNGNLTKDTIGAIRGIIKDVREGTRHKDVDALFDLMVHMSGLLIQIQYEGCDRACYSKFGFPAAAVIITLILAALTVILKAI